MYKLWVNADAEGNIIAASGGYEAVIVQPDEVYEYYFHVTAEVFKNLGNYKVVNGKLIERAE